MKLIDYKIESIGYEMPSYFQGRGVSGTRYDNVFVGVGSNEKEAMEDAAESMAQFGIELPQTLETEISRADDQMFPHVKVFVNVKHEDGEVKEFFIDQESDIRNLDTTESVYIDKDDDELTAILSGTSIEDVASEISSALDYQGLSGEKLDELKKELSELRDADESLLYHVAIYAKTEQPKEGEKEMKSESKQAKKTDAVLLKEGFEKVIKIAEIIKQTIPSHKTLNESKDEPKVDQPKELDISEDQFMADPMSILPENKSEDVEYDSDFMKIIGVKEESKNQISEEKLPAITATVSEGIDGIIQDAKTMLTALNEGKTDTSESEAILTEMVKYIDSVIEKTLTESESSLDQKARELISSFESEVGIDKAVSDDIGETEIGDVSWRFGGREVSAATPDGNIFIWDVNTIGDRHTYLLFDILDKNGESISEEDLNEASEFDDDDVVKYLEQWRDSNNFTNFNLAMDKGLILWAAYLIYNSGALDPKNSDAPEIEKHILNMLKKAGKKKIEKEGDEVLNNVEVWIDPSTNNYAFIPYGDIDYFVSAEDLEEMGYEFYARYDKTGRRLTDSLLKKEQSVSESVIEKKVKVGNKEYRVSVWTDIAVRGGEKGKGTTTSVWTDAGVRGYQGPYSEKKVKELIKKNMSKLDESVSEDRNASRKEFLKLKTTLDVDYTKNSLSERIGKGLDENYPELDERIKNLVDSAGDEIDRKYESSQKTISIEHKSRDGFMSSNDGGYESTGFSSIFHLVGSGDVYSLPDKAEKAVMKAYEYNKNLALDQFKEKYKEEIEGIPEDKLNYSDLYDLQNGDLAERLSEIEYEYNSEDTVMFLARVMFRDDTDRDGDVTFTIQGVVNWESPYHRNSSKFEDYYERDLFFTAEELKDADKVISQIKKELEAAVEHITGSAGSLSESKKLAEEVTIDDVKKAMKLVDLGGVGKLPMYGGPLASQLANSLQVYKDRGEYDGTLGSAVDSLHLAGYEISLDKKLDEADPSLQPPKEWFSKMAKRIKDKNPSYSEDQVNRTIGEIWHNQLSVSKKKEIRNRYGKTYGPAGSNQLEEQSDKILERVVNVEIPIETVLKELGLDSLYETNPRYFSGDPVSVDQVVSGQILVPKQFSGIEDVLPEVVSRAATEADEIGMESAYKNAILDHAVDLLDAVDATANYAGETYDGDQVSVSVPFGMVASVDKMAEVFRIEITNPEHMWNAITDGVGMLPPDQPVDEPMSDANVKNLVGMVDDYFEVYGNKPSLNLNRLKPESISDDFYSELIRGQIDMLTISEVADSLIDQLDDVDEKEFAEKVEKFTKGEIKASDLLSAVKTELRKRSKEIADAAEKIKESASVTESMKIGDRVRVLMGDGAGEGILIEPEEIPMKHTPEGDIPDIIGTYNPTKAGLKAVMFDNGTYGLVSPEDIELIKQPAPPNIKDQIEKDGE